MSCALYSVGRFALAPLERELERTRAAATTLDLLACGIGAALVASWISMPPRGTRGQARAITSWRGVGRVPSSSMGLMPSAEILRPASYLACHTEPLLIPPCPPGAGDPVGEGRRVQAESTMGMRSPAGMPISQDAD